VTKRLPRCRACDVVLRGPKLVVDGWWLCPDCTYEHDYGPTTRVRASEPRPRQPQAEQLFDPDDTRPRP
jgi:hypothetical protein